MKPASAFSGIKLRTPVNECNRDITTGSFQDERCDLSGCATSSKVCQDPLDHPRERTWAADFAQRCLGKDEADLGSLCIEFCGAPAETRALPSWVRVITWARLFILAKPCESPLAAARLYHM